MIGSLLLAAVAVTTLAGGHAIETIHADRPSRTRRVLRALWLPSAAV